MARRSNKATEATETAVTEAPVEETVETTEETTEATEAPAAEATEETPIDLGPFQAAANEAVSQADESTGDLTTELINSVNTVYRDIDGIKGKNQARSWLEEQMKAAIVGKDIMRARAFVELKENLSAGGGSSTSTRTPADPTTAFVNKVAALSIASTLVSSRVPEGVSEDWAEQVEAKVNELAEQVDAYASYIDSTDEDAEAPEVSPVVRQAFKLSAGKASGAGGSSRVAGGPRRDIEKHLQQVFENEEVGAFLTINEIAKAKSTEYGDDRPSAGAVSARLFKKDGSAYSGNGIEAVAEEGKPRGARKIA